MKQLNPQTIMAPNFSPGGGRVDSDFGFTFNDSNFSDRILKIGIIPDISDAKLDLESFNAIAEWAHNRKRRRKDVKKENGGMGYIGVERRNLTPVQQVKPKLCSWQPKAADTLSKIWAFSDTLFRRSKYWGANV